MQTATLKNAIHSKAKGFNAPAVANAGAVLEVIEDVGDRLVVKVPGQRYPFAVEKTDFL